MKKIVYIGPFAVAELVLPDGQRLLVTRGKPLSVTAALAALLLAQPANWAVHTPKPRTPRSPRNPRVPRDTTPE